MCYFWTCKGFLHTSTCGRKSNQLGTTKSRSQLKSWFLDVPPCGSYLDNKWMEINDRLLENSTGTKKTAVCLFPGCHRAGTVLDLFGEPWNYCLSEIIPRLDPSKSWQQRTTWKDNSMLHKHKSMLAFLEPRRSLCKHRCLHRIESINDNAAYF